MFTGIIEQIGTVKNISKSGISIESKYNDIKPGDSIAINGVCLTVTLLSGNTFMVDVSEETAGKTNLRELQPGDKLNLERALKFNDRVDGHFVTGHVEGIGKITGIKNNQDKISKLITVSFPKELGKYIVEKGSIAVDGISLTAVNVTVKTFSAAVIPFTLNNTILGLKKTGSTVNLETDMLAKYVEKSGITGKSQITLDYLKKSGF